MKLTKSASGKSKIKISKKEWVSIGEKQGWSKVAYDSKLQSDFFKDNVTQKIKQDPNRYNRIISMIKRLHDGLESQQVPLNMYLELEAQLRIILQSVNLRSI